ncbi:MAG: flagellar hook-basal body complex protein, partial [Lachnospiraceae bacterium]|nr:flagellar hook-basal body complex protein [Lachnospiraceae bacterium]
EGDGRYYVQLDDILDSNGVSLVTRYGVSSINEIANFGTQHTIPTTSLYQLLETAEYVPGADGAPGTYNMKYYPANILEGYATNQLINAAKETKIEVADGAEIAEGDMVTVSGTVELTKAEMQSPNINLIYAIDTATSTESVTNYCYYGADEDGNTVKLDPGDLDAWSEALGRSFKDVNVTEVTVKADGTVEMKFSQQFRAEKAGKYNADEGYFVGEEIEDPLEAYGLSNTENTEYIIQFVAPDGQAQITKRYTYTGNELAFNTDDGTFLFIGNTDNDVAVLDFSTSATSRQGEVISLTHFTDIDIDFSTLMNLNNGGKSTAGMLSGDIENGTGAGRKLGEMTGIEVGQDGKIIAYYDNNQSKLLGQIAVANFANPSGLAKQGDNLYSTTMNSGDFDGIGSDITENGDYMTSGVLEMSNVDLSSEFTEMITTQRGFQANSRIITVSDSMLEELVNLKR